MAIIDVKSERRKKFIVKLEKRGFKINKNIPKKMFIKSAMPITLDFKTKEIGMIGNVTCAAAALRCGAIVKEEEFWKKLQEGKMCEMEEYKNNLMFF